MSIHLLARAQAVRRSPGKSLCRQRGVLNGLRAVVQTQKGGRYENFGSRTEKEVETPWARPGEPDGQWFQTLRFPRLGFPRLGSSQNLRSISMLPWPYYGSSPQRCNAVHQLSDLASSDPVTARPTHDVTCSGITRSAAIRSSPRPGQSNKLRLDSSSAEVMSIFFSFLLVGKAQLALRTRS